MAWLAVEQNYYYKEGMSRSDGTIVVDDEIVEVITQEYPERIHYAGVDRKYFFFGGDEVVRLPEGTIEKILGYKRTVNDSPVEIPNE